MKILMQTSQPNSPSASPGVLDSFLADPWMMGLGAVSIGLIVWSSLFKPQNQKRNLASGQFAKPAHVLNAKKKAMEQIKGRKKNSVGIYLGRPQDRAPLFLPNMQQGTAVIGGPGSGKSDSYLLPAILSWIEQGFPAIVYDFKYPTMSSRFAAYAQERGYEVTVFAPGCPESAICNPLDFIADQEDGLRAGQFAQTLNRNFSRSQGGGGDKFFETAGDSLVQAVLLLAKTLPEEMQDVVSCQAILGLDKFAERLIANRESINPWVYTNFTQLLSVKDSEKTIAGILATALNSFQIFMKSQLVPSLLGKSTIPMKLTGKKLLIIGLDRSNRDVLTPLIATILDMLVGGNVSFSRPDPLGVFLDEVPTIFLPRLEQWLNENREDGLCTFLGFQAFAQMQKAYNREGLSSILTGCATKVFFNPQEEEAAKSVSNYLGEFELNYNKISRTQGEKASSTINQEERTRALIQPAELLRYPIGQAIVINPGICEMQGTQIKQAYIPKIHKFELTAHYSALKGRNEESWDLFRSSLAAEAGLRYEKLAEIDQRSMLKARYEFIEGRFAMDGSNRSKVSASVTPVEDSATTPYLHALFQ